VVPLQLQNEIRHGDALIRCEGCGVILAAPEPESEQPVAPEAPAASAVDDDDEGQEPAGATASHDSDGEESPDQE
jgi:hypothetical protein